MFILIRRNLGPKLPQVLLGRRYAAFAWAPMLAALAKWTMLLASELIRRPSDVAPKWTGIALEKPLPEHPPNVKEVYRLPH